MTHTYIDILDMWSNFSSQIQINIKLQYQYYSIKALMKKWKILNDSDKGSQSSITNNNNQSI